MDEQPIKTKETVKHLGFSLYLAVIGLLIYGINRLVALIIPNKYPNTCTLFEIPPQAVWNRTLDPCQGPDLTFIYGLINIFGLLLLAIGVLLIIVRFKVLKKWLKIIIGSIFIIVGIFFFATNIQCWNYKPACIDSPGYNQIFLIAGLVLIGTSILLFINVRKASKE